MSILIGGYQQMTTKRNETHSKILTELFPAIPFIDAEAIKEAVTAKYLRKFPPSIAIWLAAIAYIRHNYTDYDQLRDDGYDRDSALHFVRDSINETLTIWRSSRYLEDDEEQQLI